MILGFKQYGVVERYIRRIRNQAKQQYAYAYLASVMQEKPEPEATDIAYMAAQAVRMRIDALIAETVQS